MVGGYPIASAPIADSHSDEFFLAKIGVASARASKAGMEIVSVIGVGRAAGVDANTSFLLVASIGSGRATGIKSPTEGMRARPNPTRE